MMEQRIEAAVTAGLAQFWAAIAESFPEITTGDFPMDAQMAFKAASIEAARVWVTGNLPPVSFSEDDLASLGYRIVEDPDQLTWWCWVREDDGCETSYPSKDVAMQAASADAQEQFDLSRCDNCGKLHSEEMLEDVQKLSMRVAPGGMMPSGQCTECGALCYPVEA